MKLLVMGRRGAGITKMLAALFELWPPSKLVTLGKRGAAIDATKMAVARGVPTVNYWQDRCALGPHCAKVALHQLIALDRPDLAIWFTYRNDAPDNLEQLKSFGVVVLRPRIGSCGTPVTWSQL